MAALVAAAAQIARGPSERDGQAGRRGSGAVGGGFPLCSIEYRRLTHEAETRKSSRGSAPACF